MANTHTEGEMYVDHSVPSALTEVFERIRLRRNRANGRASNAKGSAAEHRCVHSANILAESQPWIIGARRSTAQEDANGIDVVVQTNIGLLYIQVKSSHGQARSFRRARRNCKAIIVIITPEMDDEKVKNKVYDALCRLRRHFMRIRRG